MIAILVSIFILILFLELPALIKDRLYKEIAVFMGFYLIGVYLATASLYDWPLYNPFEAIAHILSV